MRVIYVNIPHIVICVILTYNYIKQAVRKRMGLGIKFLRDIDFFGQIHGLYGV